MSEGDRDYAVTGYPAGTSGIFYSGVRCSGEEARLLDCPIEKSVSTHVINCEHHEDVQLACLPPQVQPGREGSRRELSL